MNRKALCFQIQVGKLARENRASFSKVEVRISV